MKKWVCCMVVWVVFFSCCMTVYATEVENSEIIGDAGIDTIEDFETAYSETTSTKVIAELEVPKGFGQSCYVTLIDEYGISYRISCTDSNEYMSSIYLAEGNYFVDYVGVYGDNTSQYSFDFEQEQILEIKGNETIILKYSMSNLVEIEQEILLNEHKEEQEHTERLEEEMIYYASGVDGILLDGNGNTHYEVSHKGTSKTTCVVTGNAIADADVVMRVKKGGVIGEAVIELSKDGGISYSATSVIDDVMYIGSLGVNVSFIMEDDAEQFQEGDVFVFSVRENFRVVYNTSMQDGYVTMFGHPVEDKKILVKMLSSGGRGSSRFTVSYDMGNTVAFQDVVPANGHFQLDDGLTIIFSDSDFAKDLEYSVEIISNDEEKNWMPVYMLCTLIGIFLVMGYVYLIEQKDKPSEYYIIVYKQKREDNEYE